MRVRQAQAMLLGIAACLAVIAWGFSDATDGEADVAWLWPLWFGLASVSTLWLCLALTSRVAHSVSGFVVPMAFAARVVAVINNHSAGLYQYPSRAWVGVAVYALLGILSSAVWVFVFGPVVSWSRQQRRGQ